MWGRAIFFYFSVSCDVRARTQYRPCACVGVAMLYSKVYDFPHTRRHFVGHWNSSNVHVDPLLALYQHYWQLNSLVAHVCYKANNDVCHTAAILDTVHDKAQIRWFLVSHQVVTLHTMRAGGYYHYVFIHSLQLFVTKEHDGRRINARYTRL